MTQEAPKLTNSQLTTTSQGNTIQITLDSKEDTLPTPTKASTTVGHIVFRSLLSTFASAFFTATVSLLPLNLTNQRIASAGLGLVVFGVGAEATLKKQAQAKSIVYGSAVVAGVFLGL